MVSNANINIRKKWTGPVSKSIENINGYNNYCKIRLVIYF